jgi:hypothetical protein
MPGITASASTRTLKKYCGASPLHAGLLSPFLHLEITENIRK